MDKSRWEHLVRGTDCPFDAPRAKSNDHWDIVAPLDVSTLYLATNQTYRGQCLLILDLRHATRPDQLSAEEWAALCADLHRAEVAIARTVMPDHINIAALGNVVPHLHWHIVPRYHTDPRWGSPIWPSNLTDMPDTRLPAIEQSRLVQELRSALSP
jgi:diadenosine tetraphosphate (Ap4A) HIT family hydrolase